MDGTTAPRDRGDRSRTDAVPGLPRGRRGWSRRRRIASPTADVPAVLLARNTVAVRTETYEAPGERIARPAAPVDRDVRPGRTRRPWHALRPHPSTVTCDPAAPVDRDR